MGYWPLVRRVVHESDILLFVLDVRMPELSRNRTLERIISLFGKKLAMVFTKIDLVSDKYLESIRARYPEAFFVSAIKNIGVANLKRALFIMASNLKIKNPIIGVVGYPNVGKSAIINALAHRAKTRVAAHANTTKGIQWVNIGGLFVLDSPGVVPFEDDETKLGILGSKDPDKLKNIEKAALKVINMFVEYDKSTIGRLYGIDAESKEILSEIAKKKGFLLKGGVSDERRAAMLVLKDWQKGKLRF